MIKLYEANSRKQATLELREMSYDEFEQRIKNPRKTRETRSEFNKLTTSDKANIKDVGGYVMGELKEGSRKKDSVLSRTAITLDMDFADEASLELIRLTVGWLCWVHSTRSHSSENPRYRVIIPLSKEIDQSKYAPIARKLAELIDLEAFDGASFKPAQLMYWLDLSQVLGQVLSKSLLWMELLLISLFHGPLRQGPHPLWTPSSKNRWPY